MSELFIKVKRMQMEVPCTKRGRPSYKWVVGYLVQEPTTGHWIYPPVRYREMVKMCRDMGHATIELDGASFLDIHVGPPDY